MGEAFLVLFRSSIISILNNGTVSEYHVMALIFDDDQRRECIFNKLKESEQHVLDKANIADIIAFPYNRETIIRWLIASDINLLTYYRQNIDKVTGIRLAIQQGLGLKDILDKSFKSMSSSSKMELLYDIISDERMHRMFMEREALSRTLKHCIIDTLHIDHVSMIVSSRSFCGVNEYKNDQNDIEQPPYFTKTPIEIIAADHTQLLMATNIGIYCGYLFIQKQRHKIQEVNINCMTNCIRIDTDYGDRIIFSSLSDGDYILMKSHLSATPNIAYNEH